MNLGLILGDVFETKKGTFVVTGIQFQKGRRIGVLIKAYNFANDDRHSPKFLSDELIKINEFKYKGNELL